MSEYRLHCFAQSGNAYKVALMLALTRADWEPVLVDFFGGETREPAFRRMNPMGEVPVLEHDRLGDEVITQSGAILDYLSLVREAFDPGPENAREALRWMLWDAHRFSGTLGPWRFLARYAPEEKRDAAVIGWLEGRARGALEVLEAHLADRDWIACDWPSTADLACAGYVFYAEDYPIDWEREFPAIAAWRARIAALEGWAHPYDLMPGHPRPGETAEER